jgi:hypothetical protein
MTYDPYRYNLEPGEVPSSDKRPGYSASAILWIVCAVVLILGGAVLIGTRDASTPEASIQAGPHTTGSVAGGE